MESFLKEQLKRIQDFAKQMSSLETHTAELTRERDRQREAVSHGPLADVKDLRTYSSAGESRTREPRATADDGHRKRSRRRRRRSR